MRKLNKKNCKETVDGDVLLQTINDPNIKFYIGKDFKPVSTTYVENSKEMKLLILRTVKDELVAVHDGVWEKVAKIQEEDRSDVILEVFTNITPRSKLSKAEFFVKMCRRSAPLDFIQFPVRNV